MEENTRSVFGIEEWYKPDQHLLVKAIAPWDETSGKLALRSRRYFIKEGNNYRYLPMTDPSKLKNFLEDSSKLGDFTTKFEVEEFISLEQKVLVKRVPLVEYELYEVLRNI